MPPGPGGGGRGQFYTHTNTHTNAHTHTHTHKTHARRCKVRISIIEESSTGGHKFRLSGVAVHKQDKVMSYMYAPVYD